MKKFEANHPFNFLIFTRLRIMQVRRRQISLPFLTSPLLEQVHKLIHLLLAARDRSYELLHPLKSARVALRDE